MPGRPNLVEIPICGPPASIPRGQRVYAIGDIHGRLDLFQALVARIRADNAARGPARVRLILLGDLVDRGPDSAELVSRCRSLALQSRDFLVLKGNHEAIMLDALRGNVGALALWLRTGGGATLRSWGVPEAWLGHGASPDLIAAARERVPADILVWLDALPTRYRVGDYLFVHAGVRPGVPIARQTAEDMLWIRREFLDSAVDHSAVVVHGHSISESGVEIRPNRIGIDTGAYRTDILTALALEDDRRWTLATDAADVAPQAEALQLRWADVQ